MARIVSASAESSGPAGAGSTLPRSGAKRAMRSACLLRNARCDASCRACPPCRERAWSMPARLPPCRGRGLACRNKALVTTRPTQQETQQRDPSLPCSHYPYSCAYPAPRRHYSKGFVNDLLTRAVDHSGFRGARTACLPCGVWPRPPQRLASEPDMPTIRGNFSQHRTGSFSGIERFVC
jgi:hypothetical protein